MPTFDAHANFAYTAVDVAPSPATSGTSLTVASGDGALFPTAPFNATVWPPGAPPLSVNAEIVRVTAVVGDVLTITRAQESTVAIAIAAGYQFAATLTKKVVTDLETAINAAAGGVAVSAGTNSRSSGTVNFSNSNGVSFGMNTAGVLTASIATNYLTTAMASNRGSDFVQATAAFNGTNASGTIGSNGISLSVGNYLTTAAVSDQVVNSINGSTGTFSFNTGSSLSSSRNGNAITFGLASNITTALQSAGNYLTTARASTDAIGLNTAGSNVTWTVNSSGLSLDARGYAGTGTTFAGTNISATLGQNSAGLNLALSAGAGGAGDGYNIIAAGGSTAASTGTIVFSNANGVSFGLNGATVTASVVTNYLTTARASTDAIGLNTAQSNVTWTVNSSGLSLDARGYAGTATGATNASVTVNSGGVSVSVGNYLTTQSAQAFSASGGSSAFQTLDFANSNGFTFSNSAGSVIGSYTVPSVAGLISAINVSAGTTSNNLSALTFANSNGVSFGLNGSVVTATVATNYLTTARASTDAIGLATAQSNVTWTVNSNGLSFDARNYAGVGTSATNASVTLNSNGLAISVAAPGGGGGTITAFATGNTGGQSSSTTFNVSSLPISGMGNLTVGYSAGNLIISGGTAAAAPIGISAGTTSGSLSNLVFSNSNGVSFGLNGSTITGSVSTYSTVGTATTVYAVGTANSVGTVTRFAAEDHVHALGATTVGTATSVYPVASANSVGTVTRWAAEDHRHAGIGALGISTGGGTAGTTGSVQGTYWLEGSNITLSQITSNNGSHTLRMVWNDVTESLFWRPNDNITTVGAPANGSASFMYCPIDHNLSASRFDLIGSVNVATTTNNSSAGVLYSITAVVYTRNGATLSSLASAVTNNQFTWTSNATASATGALFFSAPLAVNLSADKYWIGVNVSTRGTGLTGAATTSLANTISMMGVGSAIHGVYSAHDPGANTANSAGWFYGMGLYSGTTNFSTVGLSNLTQAGTAANRANVALRMVNF